MEVNAMMLFQEVLQFLCKNTSKTSWKSGRVGY